ncbi:MAG: hypothetical protein LBR41_00180 [Rickettsiales bacterium]|jgi:hypothetical protein|nr:hypothetical protein [Rickettsiales bacterium]
MKEKLILLALKILGWCAVLGVGIWYLSSSLGNASLGYVDLQTFLGSIGVCENGVCDIAAANGCFLCPYIDRLFYALGVGATAFWNATVGNIWIILCIGFVIYMFMHTFKFLSESNKANAKLDGKDNELNFKEWMDGKNGVWRQAVRVLLAGVAIGAIGYGGTDILRLLLDVTVGPVLYIGAQISMIATGVASSASCPAVSDAGILSSALGPFMCVVGNANTVVLAGASGGFSLMNIAWAGMGGGLWTWVSGLALVIAFLFVGFNIFFEILNVIFLCVFFVLFLPLLIAAWAFENVWELIKGVLANAIGMLAKCAIRMIAITLQVLILYAAVSFASDRYFPGLLPGGIVGSDAPAYVTDVFRECHDVSLIDGQPDVDKFAECFNEHRAENPDAFGFLDNGWELLCFMIMLAMTYFMAIEPAVKKLLGGNEGNPFEYGKAVKQFGAAIWSAPKKLGSIFGKALDKEPGKK